MALPITVYVLAMVGHLKNVSPTVANALLWANHLDYVL
jgi:hypothetical protein